MIKSTSIIKCKVVIDNFRFSRFDELEDVVRNNPSKNELGRLYKDDTFRCDRSIAKYLYGENDLKKHVIEIVEILPSKKDR